MGNIGTDPGDQYCRIDSVVHWEDILVATAAEEETGTFDDRLCRIPD